MKTDDLIDSLARDLSPVKSGALERMLGYALLPAFVVSSVGLWLVHGFRPDLSAAIHTYAFWVKSIYPLALAVIGVLAVITVARPGGLPRRSAIISIAVYAFLVVFGLLQLNSAPSSMYPVLIFGISAWFCPFIIVSTACPVYLATIWFLRRAAPTHTMTAGFVAGMSAGAIGAWIYSWGCIENGLPFVALWYTLGIVLSGLIGLLLARPLLRW